MEEQKVGESQGDRKNFMKPQYEDTVAKREQFAVNLRKKKQQDIVQQKRRKIIEASKQKQQTGDGTQINMVSDRELSVTEMESQFYQGYPAWRKCAYADQRVILDRIVKGEDWERYGQGDVAQKIQFLLNQLINKDLQAEEQLALVTKVRQELADPKNPPSIDKILADTTILQFISQILYFPDNNSDPKDLTRYLKLEATWCLTNIGFGTEEDILQIFKEEYSLVDHINRILSGNDLQMIDQVIWLLANSAGESVSLRNLVCSRTFIIDCLTRIIVEAQQCQASLKKGLINNIVWCIGNLTRTPMNRSNGQPAFHLTADERTKLLYIIQNFLGNNDISQSFVRDTLWCMSYLLDNADDTFITQVCQGKETMSILIKYLNSPLNEESTPSLRCVGQVASSDNNENIDLLLFHGLLDAINNLIQNHQSVQTVKEGCWILSNICAGTDQHIHAFLNNQDLVNKVMSLQTCDNNEMRREAMYVFTNLITSTQDAKYHAWILDYDNCQFMKNCVEALKMPDPNLIIEVLQTLNVLLALDAHMALQGENAVAYRLEMLGGLNRLEDLQTHPNISIYKEVEQIINNYFKEEDTTASNQTQSNQAGVPIQFAI